MLNYKNQRIKNQLKFLAIVAIFIIPFIAAQLYYHHGNHQGGITNLGTLLNNPHNISELGIDNTVMSDKKWRALYLAPSLCDDSCDQVLDRLQQVHIAMGKNINRFQPIILHKIASTKTSYAAWDVMYKKYDHIISRAIPVNNDTLHALENNKVYLVDPNGNIILSYEIKNQSYAEKILKDAKKLMNLSKIG